MPIKTLNCVFENSKFVKNTFKKKSDKLDVTRLIKASLNIAGKTGFETKYFKQCKNIFVSRVNG